MEKSELDCCNLKEGKHGHIACINREAGNKSEFDDFEVKLGSVVMCGNKKGLFQFVIHIQVYSLCVHV